MSRAEFSRKTRAQGFERAQGHCEDCGAKLFPGNVEYDHVIPASEGGGNDLGNLQCLCRACHGVKTKQDVKDIARIRRVRDKNTGAARKRSKFPTSRDGKFKQKISGEIVPR